MTAHRHRWTAPDRPDVLECADCGAICTWDLTDRSTHPDARRDREAAPERKPAAGWVQIRPGSWAFTVMGCTLQAINACDGSWIWTQRGRYQRANSADRGIATTLEAAQLAAEDALRSIAAEILRAVGS